MYLCIVIDCNAEVLLIYIYTHILILLSLLVLYIISLLLSILLLLLLLLIILESTMQLLFYNVVTVLFCVHNIIVKSAITYYFNLKRWPIMPNCYYYKVMVYET